MIDLLGLSLLVLFGALGAWRGALLSGARLVALGVGYAVALQAGAVSGPRVAESLGLAPWLGPPLAATGAFVASQVLFALALRALAGFDRRRLADGVRSAVDRGFGAIFGLVRGTAVVLLLGWLLLFVDALRLAGVAEDLPDLSGARLPGLSGDVAGGVVRVALGEEDPAARVAAQLAARPGATAEGLRGVLEHPRFEALQADTRLWEALDAGDIEAALDRPSLRHFTQDRGLRKRLGALGMIDGEAVASPQAFRETLGEGLEAAVPRLQRLRRDPELGRLLSDPEVRRLLEARDVAALLARPDFRELVGRVLEDGEGQGDGRRRGALLGSNPP